MILGGSNAGQVIDDNEVSTAASSITQLLVFDAVKRGRKESVAVRHNSNRETVLPLYLFCHGSIVQYIPCHLISAELGDDAYWGLLFMHAISGRDTVSAFFGIGKKTAWAVWQSIPQLTPTFVSLSRAPAQKSHDDMDQIERYVVLLYQ